MKLPITRYQVAEDPLLTERRVELVVIAVLSIIVLQLLWGLFRLSIPALSETVAPTAESMQVSPLSGLGGVQPEQREEIRARPLFWVSREPLEPVPVETPAQPKPEETTRTSLKGVKIAGVFGSGDEAGIIVISKGKKRRLMVGQDLDGWTLTAVKPTEARLTQGLAEEKLTLQRGTVTAVNKAPAPARSGGGKKNNPAGEKQATKEGKPGEEAKVPQVPDGLGLGGGDRNRGNTNK